MGISISILGNDNESNPSSDSKDIKNLPVLSNRHLSLSPLSKDAAMGLVMSAATGRGWTIGSRMEGAHASVGIHTHSSTENVSTFPWSLFTKSPCHRMLVAFTCNICGQRTTRAINPHPYTDGTVFVQEQRLLRLQVRLQVPIDENRPDHQQNQGVFQE